MNAAEAQRLYEYDRQATAANYARARVFEPRPVMSGVERRQRPKPNPFLVPLRELLDAQQLADLYRLVSCDVRCQAQ